ncbi:MAG TPA: ABC transporter permease [Mucilaginibacter sp.]|nr:ABC transporter permease [Mucilaginibacter sp.]
MNTYALHISFYDALYLGAIFVGMCFALLLGAGKGPRRPANLLLALAVAATVLPLPCSLAIGPLIYLYVRRTTQPADRPGWKNTVHGAPLIVQVLSFYSGWSFQPAQTISTLLTWVSVCSYLLVSRRLILACYKRLQPVLMDRPLNRLRWLSRLLASGALLCIPGLFYTLLYPHIYNPVFLLLAFNVIAMAALAFLRAQPGSAEDALAPVPAATAELRQKAAWLKKKLTAEHLYRNPELNLVSLAAQTGMQPHELSRIVNLGLKKNFNDLIGELRVREVIRHINDPAYAHLTLLGIAFEAGFNSKSTFNRIFKEVTGKSPLEYKKERPNHNLGRLQPALQVVSLQKKSYRRYFMLRNYFKIAFRNLWAKKAFSAINISGLAVGMAGAILIGLWVQNEYSFDAFHANNPSLYKVWYRFVAKDYTGNSDVTAGPLAAALKQEFPEVKSASRIYWTENRLFNYQDKSLKAQGNEVDKDFLSMFTFPLVTGDARHVLDEVNSIVLTRHLAVKLFGDTDPVGQLLKLDNKQTYKVTGVLRDLPDNTQFDFEYLVPMPADGAFHDNAWNSNSYYSYVQLRKGTDVNRLNAKLRLIVQQHAGDKNNNTEVFLYPFSKMHLYSRFENGKAAGGKIEVIRLLLIVAGIILLTACINFMNLSTAQSHKRAMEVGVRKVMGAGRSSLIGQFLSESLLITLIAGLLGLLLAQLGLPAFNTLTGKHLHIGYLQPLSWLLFFVFVLLTGLLAGSYPAFFLSAFRPVKVLKGRFSSLNRAINPRKVLVVVQFTVAVVLIVSTIVVYRQIGYAQSRDTGYNSDHLIQVPVEGDIRKNFTLIKTDLLASGAALSACETSFDVTVDGAHGGGISTNGSNTAQQNLNFSRFGTSGGFIKTMGMKLLAGRDIDFNNYPSDSASCMLNETAVKQLGIKDPVGSLIYQGQTPLRVVGVFKDFIINSPYVNTGPMIVFASKSWIYNSVIRLNGAKGTAADLKTAEQVFKKYNPAYPFTYQFVDEAYRQKFSDQQQTGQVAAIFACLTVIISCLGLFGLASYMAESRAKEIGIRKVLGASVLTITRMLTREFVTLVLIAILVAVPLAFWLSHQWLQGFAYRISIGWLTFVIAGMAAIIIAVLTVGFQSVKAALSNPVDSIRSE